MTQEQSGILISEAAIALAEPNPDGSVNEDRVNLKIEELLEAAEMILRDGPPAMTGQNFDELMQERTALQQRVDEIDREAKELLAQHLSSKPGKYEQHPDGSFSLRETNVTQFPTHGGDDAA
jgi:hypothetical protein